jgi:hypothetical protein
VVQDAEVAVSKQRRIVVAIEANARTCGGCRYLLPQSGAPPRCFAFLDDDKRWGRLLTSRARRPLRSAACLASERRASGLPGEEEP